MFVELWPGMAIPKFHWILHIAMDIWLNGPPRAVSCIRFEAAHQFWKRLGRKLNFNGFVPSVLATRRSRHVAFKTYTAPAKQRVKILGKSTATTVNMKATGGDADWASALLHMPGEAHFWQC